MEQVKTLILKVCSKSVIPHSWNAGVKNGISGIQKEIFCQFKKEYSYSYLQKMIQELCKDSLLKRWKLRVLGGYAQYEITKEGQNFLKNLERKTSEK